MKIVDCCASCKYSNLDGCDDYKCYHPKHVTRDFSQYLVGQKVPKAVEAYNKCQHFILWEHLYGEENEI